VKKAAGAAATAAELAERTHEDEDMSEQTGDMTDLTVKPPTATSTPARQAQGKKRKTMDKPNVALDDGMDFGVLVFSVHVMS
jgi:hypothetical protein